MAELNPRIFPGSRSPLSSFQRAFERSMETCHFDYQQELFSFAATGRALRAASRFVSNDLFWGFTFNGERLKTETEAWVPDARSIRAIGFGLDDWRFE
jgi:hypothetical protein